MMKGIPPEAAARWRAFQRKVKRRRPDKYELFPFQSSIELRFGGTAPRKIFYCTKPMFASALHEKGLLAKDWLVINRYIMPTEEAIIVVRSVMKGFGISKLLFIGDLDPLDLTNFAILRAGTPDFSMQATPLDVEYIGIDDGWLDLAERLRLRAPPEYDQPPEEQEHFGIVLDLLPDLQELVGPRAFALLCAGKQVEIEAAFSSAGYEKGFAEYLSNYFDSKAKRLMRGAGKAKRH